MRLAGQIKMGYYPTPPRVVELLKSHISFPSYHDRMCALDPCCGEGTALASLAGGRNVQTYGIELDHARAAEAGGRLTHFVCASFDHVDIPPEGFGLLFLNPPYDSAEGERNELAFLRGTIDALVESGVLVYIIPQKRLSRPIAECLAANFSQISVHRFPDGEYERFGQIVVIGRKHPWPINAAAEVERLLKLREGEIPSLEDAYAEYTVFPSLGGPIRKREVQPEELLKLVKRSPLIPRLDDLLASPHLKAENVRPPTRLHVGHLGLLLAAGRLNGVVGSGPDRHLVAGKPVKHIEESTDIETDEEGTKHEVTKRLETFRVTIKLLLPSGELKRLV